MRFCIIIQVVYLDVTTNTTSETALTPDCEPTNDKNLEVLSPPTSTNSQLTPTPTNSHQTPDPTPISPPAKENSPIYRSAIKYTSDIGGNQPEYYQLVHASPNHGKTTEVDVEKDFLDKKIDETPRKDIMDRASCADSFGADEETKDGDKPRSRQPYAVIVELNNGTAVDL